MYDLNPYLQGKDYQAYNYFGFHKIKSHSVFRVFAPGADAVHVIGSFNNWEGDPMREIQPGVFEKRYRRELEGEIYKYQIHRNGYVIDKADPYGYANELRPNTASVCYTHKEFKWNEKHLEKDAINIYELYLGSWTPNDNYIEIAKSLVGYLKEHHFTHIEIMPVTEYPFDGSWGYQVTGYFSITSRYGSVDDFKLFVDIMHQNNIGVIVDWVPTHFVKDGHGLSFFNGDFLYESGYEDLREIDEWGTRLFDFSRGHVKSFMYSSAHYLMTHFNIDGIRVDAVNYLIYYKGDATRGENHDAINFMKELNEIIHSENEDFIVIAEDSSAYPQVTSKDGLGFDYKWAFGWMHDTLKFFALPFEARTDNSDMFTFASMYFESENYVLMLSHDEVVHEKGTIINKMYGSYDQKFDQLKCLYLYMFTFPGIKGNFMGNEIASFDEFDEHKQLSFDVLNYDKHQDFSHFFKNLAYFYKCNSNLANKNFSWALINKTDNVYSYMRDDLLIILNLSNKDYNYYSIECSGNFELVFGTAYCDSHKHYRNAYNTIKVDLNRLSGMILRRVYDENK